MVEGLLGEGKMLERRIHELDYCQMLHLIS